MQHRTRVSVIVTEDDVPLNTPYVHEIELNFRQTRGKAEHTFSKARTVDRPLHRRVHDVVSGKHCVVKMSFRHRPNIDNDQTGHPRYYRVRSGDHITRDITTATMYLEPYICRTGRVHISWQMQLEHRKWGRHVYVRVCIYACVRSIPGFSRDEMQTCNFSSRRNMVYALFTCAVTLSNYHFICENKCMYNDNRKRL